VNIAARLQELAGSGGILVSGPVYEQVHNKLTIGFDYLGRQQVKNVAAPVSGYRVIANGVAGERQSPAPPDAPAANAEVRRALARDITALPERRSPAAFHDRVLDWLADLPRPIASIIVVSVFLFLVNLFTGFKTVWFHWPVSAMFLVVVLWSVLRRRSSGGRRRSRRE
jgi:adenylate cyclase